MKCSSMYSRQKSEGTSIVSRCASSAIGLIGPNQVLNQVIPENLQTTVPNIYDGVLGSHRFRLLSSNKIGEKMVEKKTFFSCFFSKKRKGLTIKKKIFMLLFYAENQTITKL